MDTGSAYSNPPTDLEDERSIRINLAAVYRLFEHFGWSDLTYTHVAARLPQRDSYLINPYGLLFDEITASNLVAVDFRGNVIDGRHSYNKAGHVVHTSILRARSEINYVLHSHTRAGAAVSAMRGGILPLSQPALVVRSTLAYHPYAVTEEGSDEGDRLAADLGGAYLMLLQNHGLLACGRTAGEAFLYHYFLQSACEIQVDVMRAGGDYVTPPDGAIRKLSAWAAPRPVPWGGTQWEALLRMLDRKDPSYRD